MKILLTGVTGYIAKRLLPVLLSEGHEVVCCVRDKRRFDYSKFHPPAGRPNSRLSLIEIDFLDKGSLEAIPEDIDVAYYLIHSMSSAIGNFEDLEKKSAENFRDRINRTAAKQVIYLSGIINSGELSKHLSSRKAVEDTLNRAGTSLPH